MTIFSYLPAPGTVYFIGAGPGAPDLITVRGRDIIAQADLILYADSLVEESVANLARKPEARIVGSSGMHLEQMLELMVATARTGGIVARVHSGDPALYGAVQEQMAYLDDYGVPYTIVPGVTAAFAAAARLGVELTVPEVVQTIILTRAAGRTPMPAGEDLRGLAAHGASLAIYLSVTRIRQVVEELLAGGTYSPDTPVVVLHRVTWADESMVMGTLADIVAKVKAAGYTRQALILVSPALDPALKRADRRKSSHLYSKTYTHRFRRAEQAEDSEQPAAGSAQRAVSSEQRPAPSAQPSAIVVIAVTRQGTHLAARLAHELGAEAVVPAKFAAHAEPGSQGDTISVYSGSVVEEIRRRWPQQRQLVLIMSTGIAVRAVAPLIGHKSRDPAVVCVDEAGHSAIPLLGGHQAGANDLAQRIAAITSGHAAITTASDVQHKPALDRLGQADGWRIDPASALTHASACLVNGELLGLYRDPDLRDTLPELTGLEQVENLVPVAHLEELASETYAAGLIISHRALSDQQRQLLARSVLYRPPALIIGMGCRQGVPAAELRAALEATLASAGMALESVAALATVDLKADEPGLRDLAAELGVPLHSVARERLVALDPAEFSPSAAQAKFELPGVAEPCAVLVADGDLLVPKRSFERCTVAVALQRSSAAAQMDEDNNVEHCLASSPPRLLASACLLLVSIGPGDPRQMTLAAREALCSAEVVIGYRGYIDLVQPLLAAHQEIVAMPMKSEVERAQQAIDLAAAGRRVALISSGDIGIYAMAGPVFEILREREWPGDAPAVEVFPGVSTINAAAARLGAAISHDFCTISLSDLLTPWEVIERRLWAAARGDFVVALYNPRSRERDWQLARAQEILLTYRPATTPAAIVRNVTRPNESHILTTLADLDPTRADMFSLVLVGNSLSYTVNGHMATPRGYTVWRTGRREAAQTRGNTDTNLQAGGASEVDAVSSPYHPLTVSPPLASTYPITLTRMSGAPVVVVGGGQVGERKVAGLLASGAHVRLISPQATAQLQAWAEQGQLRWDARPYQAGDLNASDRPALVFAATDQRQVNAQVSQDAQALGLLCNVVDAPEEGNFHLPAVYRADGLAVAVSTDGASPARARHVRDRVAEMLEAETMNPDVARYPGMEAP